MSKEITHLIIVEGKDDKAFFEELIRHSFKEKSDVIKIDYPKDKKDESGSITRIKDENQIEAMLIDCPNLKSVIIVCDADTGFSSRKHSIDELCKKLKIKKSEVNFSSFILPDNCNDGYLEKVILEVISENEADEFIKCVNRFGECVSKIPDYNKSYLSKLKMISYLYSATGGNRGIFNAIESYRKKANRNGGLNTFFVNFDSNNISLKNLKKTLQNFIY